MRALFVCALAILVIVPAASASGGKTGSSGKPKPRYLLKCGDFHSSAEWYFEKHTGHEYVLQVQNLKCHPSPKASPGLNPFTVSELALLDHPHPWGYKCRVYPVVESGYCYKGNVHTPAKLKFIVWEPEK